MVDCSGALLADLMGHCWVACLVAEKAVLLGSESVELLDPEKAVQMEIALADSTDDRLGSWMVAQMVGLLEYQRADQLEPLSVDQ